MKKLSTITGASISILVTIVLFIAVMIIIPILLPPSVFQTSDYYIAVIFMELIPLGLGVWLYLFLTKQEISDVISVSKPQTKMNKKNMVWLIVIAAAMAIVGRYFIGAIQLLWLELLDAVGYQISDATMPPIKTLSAFGWGLLGVAVVPAIFEELIFRGILQKGLLRSVTPKVAIIVSSVMFMLMHLGVESLLYTFLFGCLLGYMAYACGSIIPSMVFHFVNNALVVVTLYLVEKISFLNIESQAGTDYGQIGLTETVFITIFAIGSLVLLGVAIWGFFRIAKSPPKNPYLKPMKPINIVLIALSGGMLFLVLVLFAVVQNML